MTVLVEYIVDAKMLTVGGVAVYGNRHAIVKLCGLKMKTLYVEFSLFEAVKMWKIIAFSSHC